MTRDAVLATLRAIADVTPAGSTVIFDNLDTDAFVPDRANKRMQVMLKRVRQMGGPMKAGFDPSTLAAELARLGLRLYEDLSPSDIEERYFQRRTDGYHACEHLCVGSGRIARRAFCTTLSGVDRWLSNW